MFKPLPVSGAVSFSFALERIVLILPRLSVPLHGKPAARGEGCTKIHRRPVFKPPLGNTVLYPARRRPRLQPWMNAVRHKDSGKTEWGERDVVPLSPAVRKANRRNKVVPRACPPLFWRACPWGSTDCNVGLLWAVYCERTIRVQKEGVSDE